MTKCPECDKRAYFGVEMKQSTHCKTHILDNMINVVSKRCIEQNCPKYPVYNIPGSTKPLYCRIHAKDDMVNVVNKRCNQKIVLNIRNIIFQDWLKDYTVKCMQKNTHLCSPSMC
jgi:hypothetical protein